MANNSDELPRNLVLCSDGTGNSGGKGNGTNVWWLYRAIDRNRNQIAFHDDGVGTENNKYIRLFGGATGFGFTRNVKDLYKYLVRNYQPKVGNDPQDPNYYPGDDIYLFGFSRGAYTVRALAAFILYCGIVRDGPSKSEKELDEILDRLIGDYKHRERDAAPRVDLENFHKAKIKCVGVWDTVSAIGVPFDLGLKNLIEKYWFAFNFKSRNLSTDVEHAFHALAIDDQRLTFHPVLWNPRPGIEQVWFAGVHSNVGGGYPKQGLSYLALDWMMENVAEDCIKGWGLRFDGDLRNEARLLANAHDKLYDSRAGLAAYYRFRPRDLERQDSENPGSQEIANGAVRIHASVFERIYAHTLGYNPGNLPCDRDMELVNTSGTPSEIDVNRENHANETKNTRQDRRHKVAPWVERGKGLHMAFILLSLIIAPSLLRLGLVSLFPGFAHCDWIISAAFAIGIAGMMVGTETFYRWILCPIALLLLGLAQFVPEVFGTPSAEPIKVWPWMKGLLDFLLPDQAADTVVTFIERYPFGALLIVIAIAVITKLKFVIDRGLAAASERLCDTVRDPKLRVT
jgi:T6SS, Phospholipase effector Tle1-like, catalytic domain